jgi:hypothetical protein
VSRFHARLKLGANGSLTLVDKGSRNGSYLQRNDTWIRFRQVTLCVGDRIRLGECEVPLAELSAAFGKQAEIRLGAKLFHLRQGAKGKKTPGKWDEKNGPSLQKLRRNPLTGKIEEDRL